MRQTKRKLGIADHIGRGIDGLIGVFSPKSAFVRKQYRVANSMLSSYKGAESGYLRENWVGSSGSADQDILPNLKTLRKRSRDLNRNDAFAAGITATTTTNTVGLGIRPQAKMDSQELGISPEQSKALQKQAERIWSRWETHADACNKLHIYDIQHLVDRQILENGECFIMPLMVNETNRPYQLALDVIEGDRVDTPWGDYGNKDDVRQGVALGTRGQPIGYWVKKTHPGDYYYGPRSASWENNYTYVPALNALGRKNIFHLFVQQRAGQTRGVPFFAPALTYFHDISEYVEAELVASRIAACFSLFIKTDEDAAGVATADSEESDSDGRLIKEMYPAMVKYLKNGQSIETANPGRPNAQFDPFVNRILKMICASLNLPYNLVAKDFQGINYSSARAALLEARKYFKHRQQFLTTYLCQPIYEMLLEEAWLMGDLDAPDFYEQRFEYSRALWIASGWDYIDPEKEANAAAKNIENGTSSASIEAASKGLDWEEIMEQRARELVKKKELEEKHGIKFDKEAPAPAAQSAEKMPGDEPDDTTGPGEENGGESNEQRTIQD